MHKNFYLIWTLLLFLLTISAQAVTVTLLDKPMASALELQSTLAAFEITPAGTASSFAPLKISWTSDSLAEGEWSAILASTTPILQGTFDQGAHLLSTGTVTYNTQDCIYFFAQKRDTSECFSAHFDVDTHLLAFIDWIYATDPSIPVDILFMTGAYGGEGHLAQTQLAMRAQRNYDHLWDIFNDSSLPPTLMINIVQSQMHVPFGSSTNLSHFCFFPADKSIMAFKSIVVMGAETLQAGDLVKIHGKKVLRDRPVSELLGIKTVKNVLFPLISLTSPRMLTSSEQEILLKSAEQFKLFQEYLTKSKMLKLGEAVTPQEAFYLLHREDLDFFVHPHFTSAYLQRWRQLQEDYQFTVAVLVQKIQEEGSDLTVAQIIEFLRGQKLVLGNAEWAGTTKTAAVLEMNEKIEERLSK